MAAYRFFASLYSSVVCLRWTRQWEDGCQEIRHGGIMPLNSFIDRIVTWHPFDMSSKWASKWSRLHLEAQLTFCGEDNEQIMFRRSRWNANDQSLDLFMEPTQESSLGAWINKPNDKEII